MTTRTNVRFAPPAASLVEMVEAFDFESIRFKFNIKRLTMYNIEKPLQMYLSERNYLYTHICNKKKMITPLPR